MTAATLAALAADTMILVRARGGAQLAYLRAIVDGLMLVQRWLAGSARWTQLKRVPARDYRGLPQADDPRLANAQGALAAAIPSPLIKKLVERKPSKAVDVERLRERMLHAERDGKPHHVPSGPPDWRPKGGAA